MGEKEKEKERKGEKRRIIQKNKNKDACNQSYCR